MTPEIIFLFYSTNEKSCHSGMKTADRCDLEELRDMQTQLVVVSH